MLIEVSLNLLIFLNLRRGEICGKFLINLTTTRIARSQTQSQTSERIKEIIVKAKNRDPKFSHTFLYQNKIELRKSQRPPIINTKFM